MRRGEVAGRARLIAAPTSQDVAIQIADGHHGRSGLGPDPTRETWLVAFPGHFTNIDGVVLVNKKIARPRDIGPGCQRLAGWAEDLNAVVFAIAYEHAAVGVN